LWFLREVSIPRHAAPLRPRPEQNNVENRDWFHDGNFFGKRTLAGMTLRPWLRRAAALEHFQLRNDHSSHGTK
jgi:hypothetical protein